MRPKKILVWLGVILISLIIAALIAPFIIPADSIKARLITTIENQTGKKLQINGPLRFSFFPSVGLSAQDVVFSTVSTDNQETAFAKLKSLDIKIAAFDYISAGVLNVRAFTLVEPDITLVVDKRGVGNWEITSNKGGTTHDTVKPTGEKAKNLPFAIALQDCSIKDGHITYLDEASKNTLNLEKLNLRTQMPGANAPLKAKGSADVNGEKLAFNLSLGSLSGLMARSETALEFNLDSDLATLSAKGSITPTSVFVGPVLFKSSSLKKAMSWLMPQSTPIAFAAPLEAEIAGQAEISTAFFHLKNGRISLDANKASGSIKFDLAQGITPPAFDLDLVAEKLDFSAYVAKTDKHANLSLISDAVAAPAAGWSNERIDFSVLNHFEGTLRLRFAELLCNQLSLGKGSIESALKFGKLTVNLLNTDMYDGKGNISTIVSADNNSIVSRMEFSNVQVEKLLTALTDTNKISGKATATLTLGMQGKSEQELVSTLAGSGALRVSEGVLKNSDTLRTIKNMLLKSSGDKTDFSELTGTFTAKQGVITNNDLLAKLPQMQVRGGGTVTLPNRTLNYRLTPALIDASAANKEGLGVPLLISGSWDAPQLQFDAKAAIQTILQDPKKFQQQLKSPQIKDTVKNIKGLLKGF